MNVALERLKNGILTENVTFVQVLAMCPTLATTTSAENGAGMGACTTIALILSNVIISILRKLIPDKVRIPACIVIIAGVVTVVDFLTQAYSPSLYKSLGIFIPLIVVNCMVLGRAEAYALKNGPISSLFDGIGQGLGFTFSLTLVGAIREILSAGQIFGFHITPASFKGALAMGQAPGAFLTLGILMALINYYKNKKNNA